MARATTKQARPFWLDATEAKGAEARHKFEAARRALAEVPKALGRARVHLAAVQAIHSARRP